MSMEQQQTDSSGADKKSFNIRVPQPIALRIEEQALSLGTSPTTLIQSIIVRHFESETRARRDRIGDADRDAHEARSN